MSIVYSMFKSVKLIVWVAPPMQVLADAASGKPGYERAMTADEAPHYSDNDDR